MYIYIYMYILDTIWGSRMMAMPRKSPDWYYAMRKVIASVGNLNPDLT